MMAIVDIIEGGAFSFESHSRVSTTADETTPSPQNHPCLCYKSFGMDSAANCAFKPFSPFAINVTFSGSSRLSRRYNATA
jgi:hypothetical protein